MILADHHFKNLQNKQEKTTDDEVLENIEDMIVNTNNKKPRMKKEIYLIFLVFIESMLDDFL